METEAVCGVDRLIEVGIEHWFVVCVQAPDHDGPHVGMISWVIGCGPQRLDRGNRTVSRCDPSPRRSTG